MPPELPADIPPRRGLPRAISAATLRTVVGRQRSWRGVMREFGFTGSRTGRVLRDICNERGIDYAHFRLAHVDDAAIADAVREATTWSEALEQLGYATGSGSARATIRKHCRRLGLETGHLRLTTMAPAPGRRLLVPRPTQLRAAGPYLVAGILTMVGGAVSVAPEGLPYDLLVDFGGGIDRVQVKTGTRRAGNSWTCALSRSEYHAGSHGGHRACPYSGEEIDYFACVTGDGGVYLIPIAVVEGLMIISLRKYTAYRLPIVISLSRADRI